MLSAWRKIQQTYNFDKHVFRETGTCLTFMSSFVSFYKLRLLNVREKSEEEKAIERKMNSFMIFLVTMCVWHLKQDLQNYGLFF